MSKRKEVEKFIKDWIYKITNSKHNVKLYEDMFASMNDKEFDEFMKQLRDGDIKLQIIVPTDEDLSDVKIDIDKNYKLAEELGIDFFSKITFYEEDGSYTTEEKFLVLDLPLRRTKQTAEKGISVALNNNYIDPLTGQPKGDSDSTKLSFPEIQILVGMGLKHSLIEILRDRGGDVDAERVLINGLMKMGTISQNLISQYARGVLSTKSLKNYFTAMHIKAEL